MSLSLRISGCPLRTSYDAFKRAMPAGRARHGPGAQGPTATPRPRPARRRAPYLIEARTTSGPREEARHQEPGWRCRLRRHGNKHFYSEIAIDSCGDHRQRPNHSAAPARFGAMHAAVGDRWFATSRGAGAGGPVGRRLPPGWCSRGGGETPTLKGIVNAPPLVLAARPSAKSSEPKVPAGSRRVRDG